MKWSRFNFLFNSEKHGFLLYNSITNCFASLDTDTWEKLVKIREAGEVPDNIFDSAVLEMLRSGKILVSSDEDELNQLQMNINMRRASARNMTLTVAPTTACNFACKYCYETRPEVYMTDETQKHLIEFIRRNSPKMLFVSWYGGEPLMAFDRMISLTEEIKTVQSEFQASIVTNGFFLTEDKIEKLNDLRIRRIQITVDGPEKTHNQRRPLVNGGETFQTIMSNIRALLKSSWDGKLSIRVNVDSENGESFPEIYQLLRKEADDKKLHIYPGIVSAVTQTCASVESSCLNKDKEAEFELNLHKVHGITDYSLFPSYLPYVCQARAYNAYVVGPEGELYKCWNDVGRPDRAVGSVYPDRPWNMTLLARYLEGADPFKDKSCSKCFFLPICCGGCAYHRMENLYEGKKLNTCIKYKKYLKEFLEAHYEKKKSG